LVLGPLVGLGQLFGESLARGVFGVFCRELCVV
jgi:hypothetical protein